MENQSLIFPRSSAGQCKTSTFGMGCRPRDEEGGYLYQLPQSLVEGSCCCGWQRCSFSALCCCVGSGVPPPQKALRQGDAGVAAVGRPRRDDEHLGGYFSDPGMREVDGMDA